MDFQCKCEKLTVNKQIQLKPAQFSVEAEMMLPGSLREEAQVYYCGATAAVTSSEFSGSRILASGRVSFQLLFAQGDLSQIKHSETLANFSQTLLPQQEFASNLDTHVHISAQIQQVSTKLLSGRVVLRAIVQLQGDVEQASTLNVLSDVIGDENIQKNIAPFHFPHTVGEGESTDILRDEIELSDLLQINETLFATAYPVPEDIKLAQDGKVRVIGTVHLDAYHTSSMPGRPLINTIHTLPYEQEIVVNGQIGNALQCDTTPLDIAVISQGTGEDNSKVLRCELTLRSTLTTMNETEASLLQDAYTTSGENIRCSKEHFTLTQEVIHEDNAESGRLSITLPEGSPRIKQPLAAFAHPILLKKQSANGKLIASGVMDVTVLYMTDDSTAPIAIATQAPFATTFPTHVSQEDQISLNITEPSLNAVTSDRLEFKYILHMKAFGKRNKDCEVVTEAASYPDNEQKSGISIYFVQPEETLWDIAQRYRISKDQLLEHNALAQETLTSGDSLLIYHK